MESTKTEGLIRRELDHARRRRQWQATPVLLPRKSHGWRSLVGCSPWGRYESDTTERLHFQFSLSHNGEGNGNPLQCSCLENPGTAEPGGLPSVGSHRVGHDWSDLAAAAAADHARKVCSEVVEMTHFGEGAGVGGIGCPRPLPWETILEPSFVSWPRDLGVSSATCVRL